MYICARTSAQTCTDIRVHACAAERDVFDVIAATGLGHTAMGVVGRLDRDTTGGNGVWNMCIQVYVDMCMDMRIDVCTHMRVDMCTQGYYCAGPTAGYRHC